LVAGNEFVARVAREGPDQVIASADHAASELVIHEDRLQAFLAKSRPVDRRRRLGQAASEERLSLSRGHRFFGRVRPNFTVRVDPGILMLLIVIEKTPPLKGK
jgi:hypothetical protein